MPLNIAVSDGHETRYLGTDFERKFDALVSLLTDAEQVSDSVIIPYHERFRELRVLTLAAFNIVCQLEASLKGGPTD